MHLLLALMLAVYPAAAGLSATEEPIAGAERSVCIPCIRAHASPPAGPEPGHARMRRPGEPTDGYAVSGNGYARPAIRTALP